MTIIALRLRNPALNDRFTSCLSNPVHSVAVILASFQDMEHANSCPPRGLYNGCSHCLQHSVPCLLSAFEKSCPHKPLSPLSFINLIISLSADICSVDLIRPGPYPHLPTQTAPMTIPQCQVPGRTDRK